MTEVRNCRFFFLILNDQCNSKNSSHYYTIMYAMTVNKYFLYEVIVIYNTMILLEINIYAKYKFQLQLIFG